MAEQRLRGAKVIRAFVASLAFVFCFPLAVVAQIYPDYTELFVNDFADILTDEEEANIRKLLRSVKNGQDIEFTVVTINQMSDYGHTGEIEPFATGLFNRWGVGSADRDDGIMMLVSVQDRKIRIEVGSGYGSSKDRSMKRIIEEQILPEFRNNSFARGISRGVSAVIVEVTAPEPTLSERLFSILSAAVSGALAILKFLFWPILAGLAGLAFWLYRRWLRYSPRICPADGTPMQLLAEHWDDAHLKPGQLKEEELKSVDYDVWQCPKCERRKVEAYKSWASRYGACRSCGYKTLDGETTVLRAATKSSDGLKRIDYTCLNCGDTYSLEKPIPQIQESSSSSGGSGSSFGGGSSSGGGASGSW